MHDSPLPGLPNPWGASHGIPVPAPGPTEGEKTLVMTRKVITMKIAMTDLVMFSKALADPTRWRIVRLVMEDALCVCELADILEMPQSSVSSHVQIIRKAGLLESEKCEKWTYFRILSRYRKILSSVAELFPSTEEDFARDAVRAAQRLEKRENSCCPGPVLLAASRKF